jgi:hypothetical protein
MRAGLLSEPSVIRMLNEEFVSTWVLVDELKSNAQDPFASTLLAHWGFPMDLMFLTETGTFVSKLTSFGDLHGVHADVGHDPNHPDRSGPSNLEVFTQHVRHFLEN